MIITCETYIDASVEITVELFADRRNLKKWQDGFKSLTPVDGQPGSVGARSKIIFENKGHTIELIETILVNDLPAEFKALYEHSHGSNTTTSSFAEVPGRKTRFTMAIETVAIKGLLPKIMMLIMPGMVKKPTQKWLENFKALAEAPAFLG